MAPTIPQAVRDEVLAITLAEPPAELGTFKFRAARGLRQLRQPQTPAVRAWLAKHRGSRWTSPGRAIGRGTFSSVADLETAIGICLDASNQRCRPFSWAKDADTNLAKATPPRKRNTHTSSETRH